MRGDGCSRGLTAPYECWTGAGGRLGCSSSAGDGRRAAPCDSHSRRATRRRRQQWCHAYRTGNGAMPSARAMGRCLTHRYFRSEAELPKLPQHRRSTSLVPPPHTHTSTPPAYALWGVSAARKLHSAGIPQAPSSPPPAHLQLPSIPFSSLQLPSCPAPAVLAVHHQHTPVDGLHQSLFVA
eukprot:363940-Chlamydomonas_euryale.AAC.2